jgi:hypothetical protein
MEGRTRVWIDGEPFDVEEIPGGCRHYRPTEEPMSVDREPLVTAKLNAEQVLDACREYLRGQGLIVEDDAGAIFVDDGDVDFEAVVMLRRDTMQGEQPDKRFTGPPR